MTERNWQPSDPDEFLTQVAAIGRTLRRIIRREELWNGNRESLREALAWDPQKSIIRWAWTQHAKYRERFAAAMTSAACDHLEFIRLRSHEEAAHWLARVRSEGR